MVRYDHYRDSGFTDIAEIPADWTIGTVKNIFDVVCGATPSDNEENWGGEFPWIGPADMPLFGKISSGKRNLSSIGYNSCGTTIVPSGSIVLSTRAPIGKICLAKKELCTNQGCKCLVPKRETSTQYYAYYLFAILERLQMAGTGTTFKELSTVSLKQIPIPLLSFSDQIKISSYIDEKVSRIDEVIDASKASIEDYKQWKASIIYEAVTKGLEPNAELVDSGVEWIGKIPSDWKCCKQKYVIKLINGRAFKDSEFEESGKYRVLRVGNLFSNPTWYTSSLELEDDKYCNNGDLLYAWSMSYGPVIWNGEKVIYHYHIWKTELSRELDKRFAYYYLIALSNNIRAEAHATTMGFVTMGSMNNSFIAYPSLKTQEKIAEYLDSKERAIDTLIAEKESLISDLEEYKKSLIFEAVTGKRKVV